jgi:hypothetical protein
MLIYKKAYYFKCLLTGVDIDQTGKCKASQAIFRFLYRLANGCFGSTAVFHVVLILEMAEQPLRVWSWPLTIANIRKPLAVCLRSTAVVQHALLSFAASATGRFRMVILHRKCRILLNE